MTTPAEIAAFRRNALAARGSADQTVIPPGGWSKPPAPEKEPNFGCHEDTQPIDVIDIWQVAEDGWVLPEAARNLFDHPELPVFLPKRHPAGTALVVRP